MDDHERIKQDYAELKEIFHDVERRGEKALDSLMNAVEELDRARC